MTDGERRNASATRSSSDAPQRPRLARRPSACSTSRRAERRLLFGQPGRRCRASANTVVPVGLRRASRPRSTSPLDAPRGDRVRSARIRHSGAQLPPGARVTVLRASRVERGDLGRVAASRAVQLHRRFDLRAAPARSARMHLAGDAADLREPLVHRRPLDAEVRVSSRAQLRLVEEAGRARVRVDQPAVERRPAPVVRLGPGLRRATCVWSCGSPAAARPMQERRGDEPVAAAIERAPPGAARGRTRSTLEVARTPATTACSWASSDRSTCVAGSPMPNRTLTLFGAENVTSKPATVPRVRSDLASR